jgi:hypothetical protein
MISREKDAKAVLQRLDRLSQTEARMTAAEILKVVYGLGQEMSAQTPSICLRLAVEYYSF